jgi:peptidyl-prolyl cis-trans isomerase B (cyclophilin B)
VQAISGFAQTKKHIAKKTTPVAKKRVAKKLQPIKIKIDTDSGTMIVVLYDSTPLHRDNFVKLVKAGFYDSLLFHRVIPGFMIQGGDPTSKNAPAGILLGNGGDNLGRIPAEFRSTLFHKKGVIAAARDNNPQKESSACQFYIVEGKVFTDDEINIIEQRWGVKIPEAHRVIYRTIGGTPNLDENYTVFGEVVSGLDVIDKIAHMKRDENNRPLTDIRMHMQLLTNTTPVKKK